MHNCTIAQCTNIYGTTRWSDIIEFHRSRSLYSYAKNFMEDLGYKGYNIKIFFLLILAIRISTPFDSDFKIVPLRIL